MKLVSVNEDLVSAMPLLDEEDEPSVAVKETQWNHHHLSLCHLQKMLSICILNVLTINASCGLSTPPSSSPHPVEHEWADIDGSLAVQWGHLKPAPDSILEFFSCSYKKSECTTNYCSCAAVNLPCTDLCCCTSCKSNDSQERDDVNEIFNDDDDDDFSEYQNGGTDGEADDFSDSSEY